ncbi:hypothetical protein SBRCBS47491_002532 [Sporothrix bragantina]|uniref:Gelsolin repeat protein n=1 Tax=Sporothrix bragantina TaxID=671064 RepID=A0ABP0B7Q6_9PEZI
MSDEVSNFLRSVEQLKDRRLEEDEARSRELEEKILQDKRERQARRAERARSISPQKSSPANTPPPPSSHDRYNSSQTSDVLKLSSSPPVLGSPRSPTSRTSQQHSSSNGNGVSASSAALASALDYSAGPSSSDAFVTSSSPTKENESPFDADSKTSAGSSISRTPTLSWQRRPPSSGQAAPDRASRSRPLSIVAAENAAARSSIANTSSSANASTPSPLSPEPKNSDTPISRDQIAQALSAKDPSWFRQTADRGANSAAYRRSQVEDEDRQDLHSASARLPGLSRETSAEPDASVFSSPPPAHAAVLSALSPSLQASISVKPTPSLPLTPTQKLDPPRESIVSPPSGRTSPTRPLSPTKGAGGFVQSAMMKRSDSVKRWSVTSPPGLQRADSIASSRAALDNSRRPIPIAQAKPTSRPTSSHGRESANNSRPSTPIRLQTSFPSEEEPKEPKEPKESTSTIKDEEQVTPPSSPSKTMDPRRWSPTKTSSWLDAALNKPESPKPKMAPLPNNQPAWMVELNKAKAQKASNPGAADATPTPPPVTRKHEVKTGGLMRSGPMGTAAATPTHKPSASISSLSGKPLGLGTSSLLPKEGTPPKPDALRAGLKPRPALPQEKTDGSANELQNVFGSLRRTKTQNYVAPDVLKDNITRGKSALIVTGGPKPREKKDELKDAIMQKKADFNQAKSEGRGIATNAHASSKNNQPIPEGMAKRLELNKTGGSVSSSASASVLSYMRRDSSPSKPAEDLAARASGAETASFSRSSTASTLSGSSTTEVPDVASPAVAESVSSPPVKNFGSIGRASPKIGGFGGAGAGGSALANRFNPALAGMLARGPPGVASGGGSPVIDDATTPPTSGRVASPASSSAATEPPPGPGPQLTHMTKNRARGPRRKAPSNLQQVSTKSAEEPAQVVTPAKPAITTPKKLPPPTTPKKADIVVPQVISLVDSSTKKTAPEPSPKPASVRGSPVIPLIDSSKTKAAEESSTPSKSNVISLVDSSRVSKSPSPRSPVNIHGQVPAVASRNSQPFKPVVGNKPVIENKPTVVSKPVEEPAPVPVSQPSSPRKIDVKRMSKFLEESANQPPVVGAPVEVPRPLSPSKTGGARPLPVPRPLSPQKTGGSARPLPVAPVSPKKNEWQPTSSPAGAAGVTSPASFSSSLSRRSKAFGDATPVLAASSPQQFTPKSPATSMRLEPNSPASLKSPPLSSPLRSPTKQAQEVSVVLNDFFGADRPNRTYGVDTADILSRRPQIDMKIKTLSAQLYRVTEDGKKQQVPAHYERILFECEMYLCPHTFTDSSTGKKVTEVYFWAGDDVPEAAIQDVQVFLTREARAVGGKLLHIPQGKETAEFLLALGGIVTIRRGSSNKFDSLASSMFCGRRHLGQIVFDEVDFETSSLCSGFPYLITRQGKCYLWKGKGSNVDELSCARLIGMDLALMGELAEVEDGKESANFWALFEGSGRGKPGSADHWRLKPKYDRYAKRLFCFNASQREQIVEIHPFDQRDLSPDGIYVLDAFFEMYIIVGRNSQAQYTAFRNALDFAQEYAILAAGMEDRPFVPISTVVLEGIPRDLKSVFRKWSDDASPTRMAAPTASAASSPASSIKRGRSLRIVPLTVALQAVAE